MELRRGWDGDAHHPESGLEGERGSARDRRRRPDAAMASISWSNLKKTREKKQGQSTSFGVVELV